MVEKIKTFTYPVDEVRARRLVMKYKMPVKRKYIYLASYLRTTQVVHKTVKRIPDVVVDVLATFVILCSLLIISSIV